MKIVSLEDPVVFFHNHPKALLDFATQQGADPQHLLRAAEISLYAAGQPQLHISYRQYKQLIDACKSALNDAALGLHFGETLGVHGHGLLGFATAGCKNVGEAIEAALRFKKAISPIIDLELSRLPNHAHLIAMPAFTGGKDQGFFVEALFAALIYSFRHNLPNNDLRFYLEFNFDAPEYINEYIQLFGEQIRFNRPQNRISCNSHILDLPLHYPPTATANQAESNQPEGFLEAMRLFIKSMLPEYPTIDEVASYFNVSRSTLKRRLQSHNTSYKTIIDEVKMNKACELLESSSLSVDEISSHLYFSEGAAFRRAFKRCCGMSPSAYRRESALKLAG